MAKGIFNPDNDIWRFTAKLVDLFLLSVFWLVCSIPLFTIGPATSALYNTVVRCIRGNRRDSWTLFFRTFRDNFKVGALTSLVVLAAGAIEPFMPWLLSFAAGTMLYVVTEERIPEAHLGEHSNAGTLSVMAGFLLMMVLDVALG